MFRNKVLLITGGTGSFGNAIVSRFINTDHFREIRVFSRDEKKQEDMRIKYKSEKLRFYIGDVRDADSIWFAMRDVDYVFHAAALKQVPSCEFFPMEAYKTNVVGTHNIIKVARMSGVQKLICLSTDKAAYPINAMGMSKAMMEKMSIAEGLKSKEMVVCLTRYGNVMGSRGSVIPLFVNQINSNQPLTITEPSMTRFLMSLYDAVDLVLFAFKHGNPGDLFVNKAPSSTIGDLAEAIIQLSGKTCDINCIGIRHGEKIFETLCTREEMLKAEDMGEFYRIPADVRDLNYGLYYSEGSVDHDKFEDYHSHNAQRLDIEGIKSLIRELPVIQENFNKKR